MEFFKSPRGARGEDLEPEAETWAARIHQEKYPDTVRLPEGACSRCMSICSASRPGFELVIVWRIQIDEEGKVSPKLDLLTQVPQRALKLDKSRVVETAPLSFRSLLRVLGIEAALESLIRLLRAENH